MFDPDCQLDLKLQVMVGTSTCWNFSPCGLGFHLPWEQDSNNKCPEKKKVRNYIAFYYLALGAKLISSATFHLLEIFIKFGSYSKRGNKDVCLSLEECHVPFQKRL